jgi:predicted 3-demethylubiquinone-9 3-methyltransferase (glyoxalase superfamily)
VVDCKSQEEVDTLWEKLTAGGGEPGDCGWLKDKYGLSWQITPTVLMELISDPDPVTAKGHRTMMKMTKIDIAKLQQAEGIKLMGKIVVWSSSCSTAW